MQWYYAVGSERRGPVNTISFNGLVQNGTIGPDTLVWRTGMAEWQPWSAVAPTVAMEQATTEASAAPLAETPWPGQAAAPAEEYLPMEALWERILARGYNTSVGSCISRGWEAIKTNYWGALGTTLLFMLISGVAQQIPVLGLAAAFIVTPQLTAGVWWYYIRRARGEEVSVGNLFDGYKRGFGQLALVALLQMLLILPVMAVAFGMIFASASHGQMQEAGPSLFFGVVMVVVGLALAVVLFRWQFAHALIIDRGYTAIEALKLSWRVVGLRFWTLVGLGIVLGLILMAGALALIIGMFFLIPLLFAAMVEAYEDAVNPSE